ncbi:endothelin-converting protein [Schleiferia thermophila str. Yellowstone]|jgi:putative endopeptidase|uniref:M13 family metallopeptidase n=1 Tax=Schleiferia thermophila TaxID=884107 RepID=UPI0004E67394|nr:endothelin-converting protein [Schleiferia thermophila str. Yellowstone]
MRYCVLFLASWLILVSCSSIRKETSPSVKKDVEETIPGFDVSNLNPAISPCEDFYMYTTANWMRKNPIPESESRWGSFNILIEKNNERLYALLEEFAQSNQTVEKYSARQLCTDFYKAAMDSAAIEKYGLEEIRPLVALAGQIKDIKSLTEWFQYCLSAGIKIPFYMGVRTDAQNPERYIVYWGQSGLSLPDRDNYLRTDSVSLFQQSEYRKMLIDLFSMAGYKAEIAQKMAEDIFQIEHTIAKLHMARQDLRKPELTFNKMSLAEADKMSRHLKPGVLLKNLNAYTDSIVVTHVAYLKAMDSLLEAFSPDKWKSYAVWKTYEAYIDALPYQFLKRHFNYFSGVLYGTKTMNPRWKRVLAKMNEGLSEPLGRLFVERYFSPEAKADVEEMVENIREVFRERITSRDWMTSETQAKALQKLNAFTYKIGYPNTWKSFDNLQVTPDNYLRNIQAIRQYQYRENLSRLAKPVDKDEWFMGAHVVNAYYNPTFNEIVFPAGILQPPFYDPKADAAINYGAIGGVIGHEFSHGFDDQGRKYNAFGQLSNWWNAVDSAQFEERAQLLAEHYSMYEPLPGYTINGKMTLGENIADLGGLTLAYYAFQRYKQKHPSSSIAGFTPEQRVFLGWAQVWQSNVTDGFLRIQLTTDYHSPARYRVNGPVSMMKEFKEAWGCKEGDPMVKPSDKRVVIW